MLAYTELIIQEGFISDFFEKNKKKLFKRFDYIVNRYPSLLQKTKSKLVGSGIDVKRIEKDAKDFIKFVKKKDGKLKVVKDRLNTFVDDFVHGKKYFKDGSEGVDSLVTGIVIAACVIFLNTLFLNIAMSTFGLPFSAAFAMTAIICAPIVEEGGKLLSVKTNSANSHFLVFNIYEFLSYVLPAISAGVNPIIAIISRVPPIIVHWLLTHIHKEHHKTGESGIGYSVAVAFHAFWNLLATI